MAVVRGRPTPSARTTLKREQCAASGASRLHVVVAGGVAPISAGRAYCAMMRTVLAMMQRPVERHATSAASRGPHRQDLQILGLRGLHGRALTAWLAVSCALPCFLCSWSTSHGACCWHRRRSAVWNFQSQLQRAWAWHTAASVIGCGAASQASVGGRRGGRSWRLSRSQM